MKKTTMSDKEDMTRTTAIVMILTYPLWIVFALVWVAMAMFVGLTIIAFTPTAKEAGENTP